MTSSKMKTKGTATTTVRDGRVCAVTWTDNSTVCIASNSLSHEPTHVVRRYVKPQVRTTLLFSHTSFTNTTLIWPALTSWIAFCLYTARR